MKHSASGQGMVEIQSILQNFSLDGSAFFPLMISMGRGMVPAGFSSGLYRSE